MHLIIIGLYEQYFHEYQSVQSCYFYLSLHLIDKQMVLQNVAI